MSKTPFWESDNGMLDLSRIELRRIVATLQEQVNELQRTVEQLKEDKVRMAGEMDMMRANMSFPGLR